jgi:zinc D-Ala-D-Ala carboxypeptidase
MQINKKKAGIVSVVAATVIYITAHLTMKEATVTNTGLPNVPDSIQIVNIKNTSLAIYEPCCRHFNCEIYISSFFRCVKVNTAVGGAMNSQHKKGEACDMCPMYGCKIKNKDLFNFIRDSLQFDQLIMEGGPNGWIHASYRKGKNRHQYFSIKNP